MQILRERIDAIGQGAQTYFDDTSQVIVFGSMAAGVDRPDSDIDVLCIGGKKSKLKTDLVDLIVFPHDAPRNTAWLQSELASHVRHYGVWIKGAPDWIDRAEIGEQAIGEKQRRVEAFLRHLPDSWPRLDEGFRIKYSVKVRREAQRLILLRRGKPVPPTRMLDACWSEFSESQHELYEVLQGLAHQRTGDFWRQFLIYAGANRHRVHF